MAVGRTDASTMKWKNVLHDLYDSEKFKINSDCSMALGELLDELCTREEMIETVLSLLGDTQSNTETHDYVKVWATTINRGGLKHISNDTHQFLKALELIAYDFLIKETSRECASNEMVTNENVLSFMLLCLIHN